MCQISAHGEMYAYSPPTHQQLSRAAPCQLQVEAGTGRSACHRTCDIRLPRFQHDNIEEADIGVSPPRSISDGWLGMDCSSSPVDNCLLPSRMQDRMQDGNKPSTRTTFLTTPSTLNHDCQGDGGQQIPPLLSAFSDSPCFNIQCHTPLEGFPTDGCSSPKEPSQNQHHQIQGHLTEPSSFPSASYSGTTEPPDYRTPHTSHQPVFPQCKHSRSEQHFNDARGSGLCSRQHNHAHEGFPAVMHDAEDRFMSCPQTAFRSGTTLVPHCPSRREGNGGMPVRYPQSETSARPFKGTEMKHNAPQQEQLPFHTSQTEEQDSNQSVLRHAQQLPTSHSSRNVAQGCDMVSPNIQAVDSSTAAPCGSVQQHSITVALQGNPTVTPSGVLQTGKLGPGGPSVAEDTVVAKAASMPNDQQMTAVTASADAQASGSHARKGDLELFLNPQSSGILGTCEQTCLAHSPLPLRHEALPVTPNPAEMHAPPKYRVACVNSGMVSLQQPRDTFSTIPFVTSKRQRPSTLLSDFRRAAKEHQRAGPVAQVGHLQKAGRARTCTKQGSARSIPASVSRQDLVDGRVIGQVCIISANMYAVAAFSDPSHWALNTVSHSRAQGWGRTL